MAVDRNVALEAWESEFRAVREVLSALDPGQLDLPTANRRWTVRNLATHIAADGQYTLRNGKRLAAGKDVLPGVVPGRLMYAAAAAINVRTVRRNRKASVSELVALLDQSHEAAATFLRGLPSDAWDRSGYMPTVGRLTVAEGLMRSVDHNRDHLATLTAAVARSVQDPLV